MTYSDELKVSQLGVKQSMIKEHGAVSAVVAAEMCIGAIEKSVATCAISTTGIAGPTGGTKDKPVGTVYIGSCVDSKVQVRLFRFSGDRDSIGKRAAYTALQLLRLQLSGIDTPDMCWQHGASIV